MIFQREKLENSKKKKLFGIFEFCQLDNLLKKHILSMVNFEKKIYFFAETIIFIQNCGL